MGSGGGDGVGSPWSKGRQQVTQVDQTLEGLERVLETETGKPGKKFVLTLCFGSGGPGWGQVGGIQACGTRQR